MKISLSILASVLAFSFFGCDSTTKVTPLTTTDDSKSNLATAVAVIPATSDECQYGGSVIVTYTDLNTNFAYDDGEPRVSTSKICNGQNGQNGSNGSDGKNGSDGSSAGILITAALDGTCQAGGSILSTYVDKNSNSQRDSDEPVVSTTTLCNGVNGSNGANGADGKGAHLSVTEAPLSRCPNGGSVYTSGIEGDPHADVTVICNGENGTSGANGTDGTNGSNGANGESAHFLIGSVGAQVQNKTYTACHHDYLYFPGANADARGWLTFRHQANGAGDQGIGNTGFQVWNVDIADFQLASEVGNVTYCSLHWDSAAKMLNFTVNDPSDGHFGESGAIDLSATP